MVNKVMTWVLIMTLLSSQSFAYASIPCESNDGSMSHHNNLMASTSLVPQSLNPMPHSMPEHDMSGHTQHKMQQQEFSMDCCDDECNCPTGTYSSVTLTHSNTLTALRLVSDPTSFQLFLIPDAFLPSLRKPPIIG